MARDEKGYVTLLIVILIAFGFLLSGGLMSLLDQAPASTARYVLADPPTISSFKTLQLATLNFKYRAPPQICGLDIALVIDNSTSINSSELTQMKNAMIAFTTALSGTPTQFSVTRFATTAQVIQGFTDNINEVNNAINSIPVGGGYTNWQDGMIKVQSTLPNRSDPDLIIFTSDGNPNRTGPSGAQVDEGEAVANAVTVANAIKAGGTKILALGIGDDLDTENLKAISGPIVGTDLTADVVLSDFDTLTVDLARFAANTCVATE